MSHYTGDGNILSTASPVWKQKIRWQRLRAGNKSREDEDSGDRRDADDEALKETIEGTITKLLDDYEEYCAKKAVFHRHTRLEAALAAKETHQELWPLMLKSDSDYPRERRAP